MLKDIHTHHLFAAPEESLVSVCHRDAESDVFKRAVHLAVGIHPWYVTEDDLQLQVEWIKGMLQENRVLAIGEGGLDKCCDTPFDLQEKAFRIQIELAESHQLPLIIHCVKCAAELIRLKKEYRPKSPWIIHGFRGKPQQAADYLRHGFYLSFGEKYAEESLRSVPNDRFFIETDESKVPVDELYRRAASIREVSLSTLEDSVFENINRLFY